MTAPVSYRSTMREINRPHYVYRCYDSADRLLYVGCSNCPPLRMEGHKNGSWWWPEVAYVRNLVFSDRDSALRRERDAIYDEMPRCNVKGRWYKNDSRSHWSGENYSEFYRAIIATANGFVGASTSRLLRAVEAEARLRYAIDLSEVAA